MTATEMRRPPLRRERPEPEQRSVERRDVAGAVLGLPPLGAQGKPIAGRVRTVKVGPRRDDQPRPHLGARAIAAAAPGRRQNSA